MARRNNYGYRGPGVVTGGRDATQRNQRSQQEIDDYMSQSAARGAANRQSRSQRSRSRHSDRRQRLSDAQQREQLQRDFQNAAANGTLDQWMAQNQYIIQDMGGMVTGGGAAGPGTGGGGPQAARDRYVQAMGGRAGGYSRTQGDATDRGAILNWMYDDQARAQMEAAGMRPRVISASVRQSGPGNRGRIGGNSQWQSGPGGTVTPNMGFHPRGFDYQQPGAFDAHSPYARANMASGRPSGYVPDHGAGGSGGAGGLLAGGGHPGIGGIHGSAMGMDPNPLRRAVENRMMGQLGGVGLPVSQLYSQQSDPIGIAARNEMDQIKQQFGRRGQSGTAAEEAALREAQSRQAGAMRTMGRDLSIQDALHRARTQMQALQMGSNYLTGREEAGRLSRAESRAERAAYRSEQAALRNIY